MPENFFGHPKPDRMTTSSRFIFSARTKKLPTEAGSKRVVSIILRSV